MADPNSGRLPKHAFSADSINSVTPERSILESVSCRISAATSKAFQSLSEINKHVAFSSSLLCELDLGSKVFEDEYEMKDFEREFFLEQISTEYVGLLADAQDKSLDQSNPQSSEMAVACTGVCAKHTAVINACLLLSHATA